METIKLCPKCGKPLAPNAPQGICPQCLMLGAFPTKSDLGASAQPSGWTPPSPEQLKKHFPQLEVLELVGAGGMGAVYKTRQTKLDRLVALKILPLEVARDAAFAERFSREARALARLNHPNIVAVYDFGQSGAYFFFIMEFVDGMNLRQVIQAKSLQPRQALELVMQVCTALQFAHDEKIVHRDIKPENILLNKKGQVKIADFGIAKLLGGTPDTSLTASQMGMGTLNYMAPEQRENSKDVDHRADIYSLGVVFYEMLTGQVPMGCFQPPSKKVQVDLRLDEVVLHALEREPERRYQHASEVKTDVETVSAAMENSPASLRAAARADAIASKRTLKSFLSNRWLWAGVGAVSLSAAAILLSHLMHRGGPGQPAGVFTLGAQTNTTVKILPVSANEVTPPPTSSPQTAVFATRLNDAGPAVSATSNAAALENLDAGRRGTNSLGMWHDEWEIINTVVFSDAQNAKEAADGKAPMGWIPGELPPDKFWSRPHWEGTGRRVGILHLSPTAPTEPAQIRFRGSVPAGRPILTVEAGGSIQGDCLLQCIVNGKKVGEFLLNGDQWSTCHFDLSPFLNSPIKLELWNAAGGKDPWHFENCFINKILFTNAVSN